MPIFHHFYNSTNYMEFGMNCTFHCYKMLNTGNEIFCGFFPSLLLSLFEMRAFCRSEFKKTDT